MVTFQQLHDLRLGKLKSAVDDWQTMVTKLKRVADGEGGGNSAAGLEKKAQGADWKGNNATVTKEFVTATAKEFDDIVTAARSVHTILSGAHSKLTKHKSELKEAVSRAAKQGIHVTAVGRVEPRTDDGSAGKKPTQAEVDAIASELKGILEAAGETDRTAAEALKFHAKDKYDFSSDGFKSFDDAQRTIKDSKEVLELTSKDPKNLSNDQLARLNALYERNGKDPIFAERVATGLGPDKTLKFFADAAYAEGNAQEQAPDKTRMQLLAGLEKGMGTTLGTATHSDSDAMNSWKDRVVALGGHQLTGNGPRPSEVYGFQAMSNLMRHGSYETEFLNKYGDALVKYEKDHTGDYKEPGPGGELRKNVLPWDKEPLYAKNQLHFGAENDAGNDPMTGFMKALSHNPEASTDFFSSKESPDNSQWTLKDRPTSLDPVVSEMGYGEELEDFKGKSAVNEATGDALFAGATGMDPGDPNAKPAEHTPGQRQVLDNSLEHLAARKDDFPSEMRDDMAKILVNHSDEVHHTASSQVDDPTDAKQLDRHQLLEVSKQISRDQDSYGLLHEGMNNEMVRDMYEGKSSEAPKESLQRAGATVGFMEEARYQALADEKAADKESAMWKQSWGYHAAGSAASLAPGVGPYLDRGAFQLSTEWRLDEEARITQENRRENSDAFDIREKQLAGLAKVWEQANPNVRGESTYTILEDINRSAFAGNDRAQGLPGRQPD